MSSSHFDEFFEEERKAAAEKAAAETEKSTLQKLIIDLLVKKFKFIPKTLRDSIQKIDDNDFLNKLLAEITKVSTLEEFKVIIDKAEKIAYLRLMTKDSPIFNQWLEEIRQEAAIAATKKCFVDILSGRFGLVPEYIKDAIQKIDNIEILDDLFARSINISTLEAFNLLLAKFGELENIFKSDADVESMVYGVEKFLKNESDRQHEYGKLAGIQEEAEKARQTIINLVVKLLTRKFGRLSRETTQKLKAAKSDDLLKIIDNIFDIENLNDALNLLTAR